MADVRRTREAPGARLCRGQTTDAMRGNGDWKIEIVKRSDAVKGFVACRVAGPSSGLSRGSTVAADGQRISDARSKAQQCSSTALQSECSHVKSQAIGMARELLNWALWHVTGRPWNHKRVYRIYRAREQNPIIEWRGHQEIIRVDNGSEYVSGKLMAWAEQHNILLAHIQPGKPQQNAYGERYNCTVRREWLGRYMFDSIREAQDYATELLWTYNNERPSMGIEGMTPAQELKMAA